MIKTKNDLKEYIKKDSENNQSLNSKEFKYVKLLRYCEYFYNCNKRIRFRIYKFILNRLSNKYITYIPLNVCEPGLSIAHLGCIFINGKAKVGKNLRIHAQCIIGASGPSNHVPILGDNILLGSGSKVIGNIKIASDVAIGANAVVTKSITEEGTTWGGVPARKISNNNSHLNIPIFIK